MLGNRLLFNAITKACKVLAANYPFATIDPNVGVVEVRDERLEQISGSGCKAATGESAQLFLLPILRDLLKEHHTVKGSAISFWPISAKLIASVMSLDVFMIRTLFM
jgi:hypothetical protein